MLWSNIKELCVTGPFCRDLRISHSKSASSFNRLYSRGQWINAWCHSGSKEAKIPSHTSYLQKTRQSPTNAACFTAFWLESIKCRCRRLGGKSSGWAPAEAACQTADNTHTHTQTHVQRAITCLLAAFCWLLHVQPEEHQSNWQPREKRPGWWYEVFLVFVLPSFHCTFCLEQLCYRLDKLHDWGICYHHLVYIKIWR